MKKFVLILLILLVPQSYAFEDYIITSEIPVKLVESGDESIVQVVPVFTIDNSKKNIMVKALKEGKTFITIETDKFEQINVEITEDKTILSPVEGLEYLLFDVPSLPPSIREGN